MNHANRDQSIAEAASHDGVMREHFWRTADTLFAEQDRYERGTDELFGGIELEVTLVDHDLGLASQEVRDSVVRRHPGTVLPELGAHQLELLTSPAVDILGDGLVYLKRHMQRAESLLLEELRASGVGYVRMGCYPFVTAENARASEGYEKYMVVPEWHHRRQRQAAQIDLGQCAAASIIHPRAISLMNSVQFTVDALGFDDAIDKLNRSLMVSGYINALAANARFYDMLDTGMHDMRMTVWSRSHDVRTDAEVERGVLTRIGMPSRYYQDLRDYLERIASYPFILTSAPYQPNALGVSNGLYWRDARIKFFLDRHKLAVEFRPLAVQPNIDDDFDLIAFFLGRLHWSIQNREPLLDISEARRNNASAMIDGNQGMLIGQDTTGNRSIDLAQRVLETEIARACEGLIEMGVESDSAQTFCDRLMATNERGDPAHAFSRLLGERIPLEMLPEVPRAIRRDVFFETMNEFGSVYL